MVRFFQRGDGPVVDDADHVAKGPINLLPTAELPAIDDQIRSPEESCLFWSLCSCLGWRSRRHNADQTSGREHVSNLRPTLYCSN